VGTVMSNFGLERALQDLGIPFERAAVGDRYVLELLRKRGWFVGGEASGHILCLDLTTTGDAIVAALQALTPMVEQGVGLRELGADVGVAFDGDGDRVVMVDARGTIVDGDELLYIIARHRAVAGTLQGGVVGTVMSNFGLERALQDLGIPFERAAVGDRYVLELLRKRGWFVGGEASGHILCLDLTTTGDAIVAALQALTPMVEQGVGLRELTQGMSKLPQVMVNVAAAEPLALAGKESVRAAIKDKSRLLDGRGRILVRASGTEPVIRVMVEGEDHSEVSAIAEDLAAAVLGSA